MYSKEKQIGKRATPKMKDRTRITKAEYQKALEKHGAFCRNCGSLVIEMHHVKYRSQGGKGTWRNLMPLCSKHHRLTHQSSMLAKCSQNVHESKYGEYYWCDKYDLYKMGLIENPDDTEFEAFMLSQEVVDEPYVHDSYKFPF